MSGEIASVAEKCEKDIGTHADCLTAHRLVQLLVEDVNTMCLYEQMICSFRSSVEWSPETSGTIRTVGTHSPSERKCSDETSFGVHHSPSSQQSTSLNFFNNGVVNISCSNSAGDGSNPHAASLKEQGIITETTSIPSLIVNPDTNLCKGLSTLIEGASRLENGGDINNSMHVTDFSTALRKVSSAKSSSKNDKQRSALPIEYMSE